MKPSPALWASVLATVPSDLRDALAREFGDLESRFARGDWSPAQLNGGRFAESVLRYLEWKQSGSFTPIGTQLNRLEIVKRVENDASLPDGVRFHLRRCAELLLDVRNKRDIAHLGTVVDVKAMDAHLVIRLASWSLSEIVREESGLSGREVQAVVDKLSERRLALVEEIDGRLIVVGTHLKAKERALVALYQSFPSTMAITDLRAATKYGNTSRFRQILVSLEREGLVHIDGGLCVLTKKGTQWTEKHVEMRLQV